MRLLAVFLLVACEPPPAPRVTTADETPLGRGRPAPKVTSGELAGMGDFVHVVEPGPIPTTALQPWLIAGSYRAWSHEATRHPSSGPHAEQVVTYLSPSLEESLRTKAKTHPLRAAAVKELFKGGRHVGWAVSVKTSPESASGKNWFWYEVLSTSPTAKAAYEGTGIEICRDCHTENGGIDQVLTDFPLH